MPRLSIITTAAMTIALGLGIAGTVGPQYQGRTFGVDAVSGTTNDPLAVTQYWFSLYKFEVENDKSGEQLANQYYRRGDFNCDSAFDKLIAAFSLGIAGCLCAAVASLLAFARTCLEGGVSRVLLAGVCALAFALFSTSFALSVTVYLQDQCGQASFQDMGLYLDWGFAVLVASAAMSLFGVALALSFENMLQKVRIVEIIET